MTNSTSRRQFIKRCVYFGAGSPLCLMPRNSSAWSPIPLSLQEPAEISDGFTGQERSLIRESLAVFYARIFTTRVQSSFNRNGGNPHDDIMPGASIDRDTFNNWDASLQENYRNALSLQLFRLTSAVMFDGHYKFPKIIVGDYYAKRDGDSEEDINYGDSLARAPLGTIFVKPSSDPGYQGCFRVNLNRYYLNAPSEKRYQDPVYWASVITHEIGHNLGHKHPSADDNTYHLYQINILEYALRSDGVFTYGQRYIPTRCSPWQDH